MAERLPTCLAAASICTYKWRSLPLPLLVSSFLNYLSATHILRKVQTVARSWGVWLVGRILAGWAVGMIQVTTSKLSRYFTTTLLAIY